MYLQHWFSRLSWRPKVKYIFLQFLGKLQLYISEWSGLSALQCKKLWKFRICREQRADCWPAPAGSDWPEERYVAPPCLLAVEHSSDTLQIISDFSAIQQIRNYKPLLATLGSLLGKWGRKRNCRNVVRMWDVLELELGDGKLHLIVLMTVRV